MHPLGNANFYEHKASQIKLNKKGWMDFLKRQKQREEGFIGGDEYKKRVVKSLSSQWPYEDFLMAEKSDCYWLSVMEKYWPNQEDCLRKALSKIISACEARRIHNENVESDLEEMDESVIPLITALVQYANCRIKYDVLNLENLATNEDFNI
ncbi:hypothetical protein CDAR_29951 [Caerostris darwini]|uniref:Uncharacterized protein n=1 Tax=Caerostris darwini TaxID=1538125 RepID=A0AAV4SBH6_9ARAC|nr:hypothetical protein CDAR_29951 [Caerostris darwini]